MVRDVFRLARENSPCIIFIDEVDAIATKRFDAQTGSDREVQRILLELLNQMDGFDQQTTVKVCEALFTCLPAFHHRSMYECFSCLLGDHGHQPTRYPRSSSASTRSTRSKDRIPFTFST